MVKKILRLAWLGLVLVVGGGVHAGPIVAGTWYQFYFYTDAGSSKTKVSACPDPNISQSFCPLINETTPADAPPWTTESLSGPGTLTVTDGFVSGDIFAVAVNGYPSQLTGKKLPKDSKLPANCDPGVDPLPDPTNAGHPLGDPSGCFALADTTYGTFDLVAGENTFAIDVAASELGIGSGYFRVDLTTQSVPTPGTLALMSLALLCMGAMQWRRNHRPTARRSGNLLPVNAN